MDDVVRVATELLRALGVDVDRSIVVIVVHGVPLVALGVVAFRVLRHSARFVTGQVRQKFWRNTGKVSVLVSFGLFLIGYGFYTGDQERPIDEAAMDLLTDQLTSVMPLAIVTQFVILSLLWMWVGRALGVSATALSQPAKSYGSLVMATFACSLVGVGVVTVGDGDLGGTLLVGATLVALTYLGVVASNRFRWRQRPLAVVTTTALTVVVGAIFVGIAAGVMLALGIERPSAVGALRIGLTVGAVLLLLALMMFRTYAAEHPDVPSVLFHYLDFTLAIAAAVTCLVGLPGSAVTLGPIPPALVALICPAVVALTVYLVHLRRNRVTAPMPRAQLLLACGLAGAVAVPARLGLEAVLTPVLGTFQVALG